ncbi:MAG: hypothetical protein KF794_14240 [Xanthobacteraceae bacterium]|nr:hypothetical protein [Xanthobacteraceae bacterium]QYK44894.1 MAG: hypothetical protein KF794_14240 [Xanthobacteraceae bacterium]
MPTKRTTELAENTGAARPLCRVVLRDHARLPGRFFGRLTASIQAAL